MRLLALIFAIQLLCSPVGAVGEYERLIRDEPTIAKKIELAEEAFASIEGFVPREMFMSFWSIDALGEIVTEIERRIQSDGLQSLLPDYDLIQRICAMEMGDHRYFFQDLKADLEGLASRQLRSHAINAPDALQLDDLYSTQNLWDRELIAHLIEVWILMGYGEGIDDEVIENLTTSDAWGDLDIENWEELIQWFQGNPKEIIRALAWRILTQNLSGHSFDPGEFEPPTIGIKLDRVSDVGPRLYY